VAVPAGNHVIRLRYAPPYNNLGGWISLLTAMALVAAPVCHRARNRRRSKTGGRNLHRQVRNQWIANCVLNRLVQR
jgi:hypothetical protein